jgi:hypothetical protein
MSMKPKKLTEEDKLKIAEMAGSGGTVSIKKLADEFGVSEDEIRNLVHETPVSESDGDDYTLEVSDDFLKSVEYGATFDKLNYKRLTFWSLFGTGVIVLFIVAVMFMFEYTRTSSLQSQSERSTFYNIEELQRNEQIKLNTFGVVDPDEGIYRIPIDSAITVIAID